MAVPSFPDVHVTGPVHHFVQAVTSSDPSVYYLGTAEVTPQVQIRQYDQRVLNDITGKTLPFDETDDGQDATISVVLTYWSKRALDRINEAGYVGGRRGINGGSETRFARGGRKFGIRTFRLWQVFENWFNDPVLIEPTDPGPNNGVVYAGRSNDLEIGWYWPQVKLANNDRLAMGSQAEKPLLVFHAQPIRVFDPSVGTWIGHTLFSKDPSVFPDSVRTVQ